MTSVVGGIVITGDSVSQNTSGDITAAETVTVTADYGAITMADGTVTEAGGDIVSIAAAGMDLFTVTSENGDIAITAWTTVTLASAVTSVSGTIIVTAETGLTVNGEVSAQGDLTLATATGGIELNGAAASAAGNINLAADSSGITVNAPVASTTGIVTLTATADAIVVNSPVSAHGDISLAAATGAVELNAAVTSGDGDIVLTGDSVVQNTGGDIVASGTVDVTADTGSITMADGTVTEAGGDIACTAAASITLFTVASENGDITLDAGTTVTLSSTVTSVSGTITITAETGLTVNGAVTALGNISLTSDTGTIELNAAVTSDTGDIVITGDSVAQNTGGDITASGTVDVTADTGSITMADETVTEAGGDIVYTAAASMTLHTLISVSGDITGAADTGFTVNGAVTAQGSDITLITITGVVAVNAPVSSTTGDIIITGDSVAQNQGGDIATSASGTVAITADVGVIVMADGTSTAAGGTITCTAATHITLFVVTSVSGGITGNAKSGFTVNGAVTNQAGDIVLKTKAGTVTVNAPVTSTTGDIVITGDNVRQDPDGDITTGADGTVTVEADKGSVVMVSGATTTTVSGHINYNATDTVNLSILTSTSGNQFVTAYHITDNLVGEEPNIVTDGMVVMTALGNIGTYGEEADIDTDIGTLQSTTHTGGIYVDESNDLVLNGVTITGGNESVLISLRTGFASYSGGINVYGGKYTVMRLGFAGLQKMLTSNYPLAVLSSFRLAVKSPEVVMMTSQRPGYQQPWQRKQVVGPGDILFSEPARWEDVEEVLLSELPPVEKYDRPAATETGAEPSEAPGQPTGEAAPREVKELEVQPEKPVPPETNEAAGEFEAAIQDLPSRQQAALRTCCRALARRTGPTSIGDAYRIYVKLCTSRNINPLSFAHFTGLMVILFP